MMRCENCEELFAEPLILGTVYSNADVRSVTFPEILCCPFCRSEDIEEVKKCSVCGEYSHSGICPSCEEKLTALSARAHDIAREVYFDLARDYSCGNESAREYIEDLF